MVLSVNRLVNFSQFVIPDFLTSQTPRESENITYTSDVDLDLVPDLDNVINLSDHAMTTPQLEIINKGFKICLTPVEAQMGDLRHDLYKYHRVLRLKSHFKDDHSKATIVASIGPFNDTSCLKLQSKSTNNPPMCSNNLKTVITMTELGLQDSIPPRLKKKNTEPEKL